jgi:hypothetical protein
VTGVAPAVAGSLSATALRIRMTAEFAGGKHNALNFEFRIRSVRSQTAPMGPILSRSRPKFDRLEQCRNSCSRPVGGRHPVPIFIFSAARNRRPRQTRADTPNAVCFLLRARLPVNTVRRAHCRLYFSRLKTMPQPRGCWRSTDFERSGPPAQLLMPPLSVVPNTWASLSSIRPPSGL